MDQGEAGRTARSPSALGKYFPPPPAMSSRADVRTAGMVEQRAAMELSPVLSSAILHYRFESIHPFADGNGRTGRALALWELYRRGFDTPPHLLRGRILLGRSAALLRGARQRAPGRRGSHRLAGILRRGSAPDAGAHLAAGANLQREIARRSSSCGRDRNDCFNCSAITAAWLLRSSGTALDVSRQGAMDLLRPLLEAGLVEKVGSKKTGRYDTAASHERSRNPSRAHRPRAEGRGLGRRRGQPHPPRVSDHAGPHRRARAARQAL